MKTRLGNMDDHIYKAYCNRLIGKIYKLLPLKEEGNTTLSKYIDSLLVELYGGRNMIENFNDNPDYLTIINSIEGLKNVDDIALFKSKVFECISICKKLM